MEIELSTFSEWKRKKKRVEKQSGRVSEWVCVFKWTDILYCVHTHLHKIFNFNLPKPYFVMQLHSISIPLSVMSFLLSLSPSQTTPFRALCKVKLLYEPFLPRIRFVDVRFHRQEKNWQWEHEIIFKNEVLTEFYSHPLLPVVQGIRNSLAFDFIPIQMSKWNWHIINTIPDRRKRKTMSLSCFITAMS
jgi:hypothetical protein